MGAHDHDDVIELRPQRDPATGGVVFGLTKEDPPTGRDLTIRGGVLSPADEVAGPGDELHLSGGRFAGEPDEWMAVDRAQAAGGEPRIVNGRFVHGDDPGSEPAQEVELTKGRFAAVSTVDVEEMRRLVTSGAAARFVNVLQSTSTMPQHFPQDPGGLYLHTRPTHRGDELHAVILRDPSTGLHHAHLWAFMQDVGGTLRRNDLNRWVGSHPDLSAHHVHLYPGTGRQGAVLCLSDRLRGGVPDLAACVLRTAQWASGMSYVVRGEPFPYQQ